MSVLILAVCNRAGSFICVYFNTILLKLCNAYLHRLNDSVFPLILIKFIIRKPITTSISMKFVLKTFGIWTDTICEARN